MTQLRFQKIRNSRHSKIIASLFCLVFILVICLAAMKIRAENQKASIDFVEEYEYLNFDSNNLVLSEYQEVYPRCRTSWVISPMQIERESPMLIEVTLTGIGQIRRIWTGREENILLEKYQNGKWYYSSKCFPELDYTEPVRKLSDGESRNYRFQLNEDMEPGAYRFTALFENGLSAGYFFIV